MRKRIIWMIIGCTVPLLLIFLAPALGFGSNIYFFIFIAAMFAGHLLMPMLHDEHNHNELHKHVETSNDKNHEMHPPKVSLNGKVLVECIPCSI